MRTSGAAPISVSRGVVKILSVVRERCYLWALAGGKGDKGGDRPSANMAQYDGRMVYVSASDEAKVVARKITGTLMENAVPCAVHGFPVYLFAVRGGEINQFSQWGPRSATRPPRI